MSRAVEILLVEDDPTKVERIRTVINDSTTADFEFVVAENARSAVEHLGRKSFDIMVLDVQLPIRADGPPDSSGGIRVLSELRKRPDLRAPGYIVGLTAHEKLINKHADEFGADLWTLLHYQPDVQGWAESLSALALHVVRATESAAHQRSRCDLLVLTALHEPELSAVLRLPGDWERITRSGDPTIYHSATWGQVGSELEVVAASCSQMGPIHAAILATKAIVQLKPRYVVLCGIAAGVGADFGDLVVPIQSWDYIQGKYVDGDDGEVLHLPEPQSASISTSLLNKLRWFSLRRQTLLGIAERYSGTRPKELPRVHMGPCACGPLVIASDEFVGELKRQNRKVVGLDMESLSVLIAGESAADPQVETFVVKGVSDLADADKDDRWRQYAAHTSAWFVYEFATTQLAPGKPRCE